METYKNIDEFIEKAFPYENEKIIKSNVTETNDSIGNLNHEFDERLKEILKGKSK
jgi:hypothetical protein